MPRSCGSSVRSARSCRAYKIVVFGTDGAVEGSERRAVRDEGGAVDGSEELVQLRRRPRPNALDRRRVKVGRQRRQGGRDRLLQQCDCRMHVSDRLSHSLALGLRCRRLASRRHPLHRRRRRRGRGWLGA